MDHGPAFYGKTFAQIHSDGYARTDCDVFGALCDQITEPNARLFDIACGEVTSLSYASHRGIPVAGCDQSLAFVETARQHGCVVAHATAAKSEIPQDTTAVTALGEVLCYHAPGSRPDLDIVLARVSSMPKVSFLAFDIIGPTITPRDFSVTDTNPQMSFRTRIDGRTMIREIETILDGQIEIETHYQQIMHPDDV